MDSHLINDLGLDSLDVVEVVMAFEDEFGKTYLFTVLLSSSCEKVGYPNWVPEEQDNVKYTFWCFCLFFGPFSEE